MSAKSKSPKSASLRSRSAAGRPRGFFITLEGPDGSGKTTQARLLEETLRHEGYAVRLTREPGGTPFGDSVRNILLNHIIDEKINEITELLMYESIRAHHVENVICPALRNGEIVICDRFIDASAAYQGYGRKISLDVVNYLNNLATNGLKPDLTILLDVNPDIGLRAAQADSRAEADSGGLDRIEAAGRSFHRRVRAGYRKIARQEPERFVLVRRVPEIMRTYRKVEEIVHSRIPARLTPKKGRTAQLSLLP